MPFDHIKASAFYLLSGILDAVDGWAARKLNQGEFIDISLTLVYHKQIHPTSLVHMYCPYCVYN